MYRPQQRGKSDQCGGGDRSQPASQQRTSHLKGNHGVTANTTVAVAVVTALTVLGLGVGILGAGYQADGGGLALVGLNVAALAGFWGFFG